MRITNKQMQQNLLNGMQRSLSTYEKVQWQVSSGKRIRTISDDAAASSRILTLRSSLREMAQYGKNIESLKTDLANTENLLNNAKTIVVNLKTIGLQAASDATVNTGLRQQLATQVDALKKQLFEIANTKFQGKYVFAGQSVTTQPFDEGTGAYNGDNNYIYQQVGVGLTIASNVTGQDAFKGPVDVFAAAQGLQDALNSNSTTAISTQIDQLQNAADQILTSISMMGLRTNQVENVSTILDQSQDMVAKMLSDEEDIDMVKAVTDLKTAENVYQSSLYASSALFKTSLLDFLK